MKKFLKILGVILLIIIVFVLVAGIFLPKKYDYEQSIVINAPREKVWSYVNSLQQMEKWSPWIKADPNIKTSFEGPEGEVGSKYSWEGNSDVGKGEQTITKSEPMSRVDCHIHFIKPFEGNATTAIILTEEGSGTKVSWSFHNDYTYPMNVMQLFFNMDEMMGKQFTIGLNDLKRLSETN